MTYSLNTLNNSGGRAASPRAARRAASPTKSRWSLGFVALVFWLLALLSYSALGRRRSPPRARAARSATGAAASAPGWPMPATSCSAFRSGGASPPAFAPGWRRWRAGCAARQPRRRRTPRRFSRTPPGLLDRAGACCCARARRSNGRACTASKPRLPDHARRRARLPGRAAGREVAGLHRLGPGVRGAGRARRGRRVPLLLEPRRRALGARASTRFIESRREKREIAQDLASASRPRASARRSCIERAHRDRGAPSRRRS